MDVRVLPEVAIGRKSNVGATSAAGCGPEGDPRCPAASTWAPWSGNAGPTTRAIGSHSRQPASPARTATQSVRLFLHNRRLAWNGFSPQLSLAHEVRETNAQGYDYKRTWGELRAVRLF